jgi:salicylate hydroxylase
MLIKKSSEDLLISCKGGLLGAFSYKVTSSPGIPMLGNLLIGGGIGGLASALALIQEGFKVTVYERSPQLVDLGAGITLAPNATRVLYHIGLGTQLEQTSVTPAKTEFRHYKNGEVIMQVTPKNYRELFGSPYMRLHRWDLQHAMLLRLAEIAPNTLQLNADIKGLESLSNHVDIHFTDGRVARADIVIAADGIRSSIRETLFNPAPPVWIDKSAPAASYIPLSA